MENKKEFFKLYPSTRDDYFWDNVRSINSDERNARAVISSRFANFNALEILEAGKEKPILNIEQLMVLMDNPANHKYIIKLFQRVYHYLPEQVFRMFAIAYGENQDHKTAQELAKKLMGFYLVCGGDFEFIKLGMFHANKEFSKRNASKKILKFEDYNLFKTLRHLTKQAEEARSLYDDVFEHALGTFYTKQDLQKRQHTYYDEETCNELKRIIANNEKILKDTLKNYDPDMVLHFVNTRKEYSKQLKLDVENTIEEDEEEDLFSLEDQIDVLENDIRVCDYLTHIVKETDFTQTYEHSKPSKSKSKEVPTASPAEINTEKTIK